MASKGWVWLGGLVCVVAGCSGKVSNQHAGAAGGAGRLAAEAGAGTLDPPAAVSGSAGAPSGPEDAGAGSAGRPVESENAGSAGADQGGDGPDSCAGTLAQAANGLGFSCPKDFCAAKAVASDCNALPAGAITTTITSCSTGLGAKSVGFQLSPTQFKLCYYADAQLDNSSPLVAAIAENDQPTFCGGTAVEIAGGYVTTDCDDSITTTLCDLIHPEKNQATDGTPPRACFNASSNTCEACCSATMPDCTGKPDNYPGYLCTSPSNQFCSCSCQQEQWQCAC